jgi:deoxyhypusine synthase
MAAPDVATSAVFVDSETPDTPICRGFEFGPDGPIDYDAMFRSYSTSGFQATSLGKAIDIINEMLHFRFKPQDFDEGEEPVVYGVNAFEGIPTRPRDCKIFLGVTSNLVSSGMREVIKFTAKYKLVDVIVVTAGGVEEDFIKCLAPTHLGDFHLPGADLRARGLSMYWAVF